MAEFKMPILNSVTIAGNLTKDPINRTTTNGTPVSNFTIACSRKFKDNRGIWREDVCYIGVVAWYKLATSCQVNLTRGSAILVEGELQSKSWKLENGFYRTLVEIKAKRIQFLNKKVDEVQLDDYEEEFDNVEYSEVGNLEFDPISAKSKEDNSENDNVNNAETQQNDVDNINLK